MRVIRFAAALVCLLASFGSRVASAQTIAGLVIDSATRQPARLLGVRVVGDSGRTVAETRTDTAGVFYALLTTGGAYRVRFALDSVTTFETAPIRVSDDGFVQRQFVVSLSRSYFDFEVQQQVEPRRGMGKPRYPDAMRQASIEGEVLAQFVVDSLGHPRIGTIRILRSTHAEFSNAVQAWLVTARFTPAILNGRHVAQMVRAPFDFKLDGYRAPSELPSPSGFPPPRPQAPLQ